VTPSGGGAEWYPDYIAACNERRFDDLDRYVDPAVGGEQPGRDAYVAGLRAVVTAFPDYRWVIEQVVATADMLAVRLTASGTHIGAFRGVPPTGRRISTQELAMYRIAGGRIVHCWGDLGSTVRDELVSGSG